MKVLPRTEFGNPILRSVAKPVSLRKIKEGAYVELIREMVYTMRRVGGVGLAAPQIGTSIQLAVMEMRPTKTHSHLENKEVIALFNPKIISSSAAKEQDWEGCLSFKKVRGGVSRPKTITVQYYNSRGEKVIEKASGLWARIFQHEIDHLNGITYLDRVQDTKTVMTESEFRKRILKLK